MKKFKLALPWQILIAIVIGTVFGIFMTDFVKYISWMGDLFLRLLKMIVIPIVFSSLIVGVASIGKSANLGRIAGKTFAYYIGTTLIAIVIGLALVDIVKPGVGVDIASDGQDYSQIVAQSERVSFGQQLLNIVPTNIISSMAGGDLLAVIFFAIIFGFFIIKTDDKTQNILVGVFDSIFNVIMKMTMFIIKFTPFGVFAIVANMIAQEAGDPAKLLNLVKTLGIYVLIVWIGCVIQAFIVLPATVRFLGKENPWKHMKKMSTGILTAFSTCSSGAALPIALQDSQQKCGVSQEISSFVLPLGSTINMNGTALYEMVTVFFLAQAYGVDFTLGQQITIAITVLMSAIGAAGIPMAGLIMLSIVLSVAGLPLEGIGIVLAVQQLCDMPRTAVNAYGNMCCAVVVAKSEGEKLTIEDK